MRNSTLIRFLFAAGALLASPLLSQEKATATALHCGKLYVGNGQVMTDVYLVVKDGKVATLTRVRPKDIPVIDATDKVVIPGIVAADSDLSRQQDSKYNVTPDFVALSAFDFAGNYHRALSGGVTTAYVSPGRRRFISGQGSVVKLHGMDMVRRVLAEHACLRITLGKEANGAPALFEPTPHPTSDDPLLPARKQFPSSRISQINELRRVFQQAQTAADVQGSGAVEDRYAIEALQNAANGSLPLRIAAKEAPDIRNAVRFAREIGTRLVLETPYEIEKAIAIHTGTPMAAVFRLSVRPGGQNAGGENRSDKTPKNRPENAVLAARAGMRIALVPGTDADLQDFLLVASIAIRMGLSEEQALQAITLDAAKLLGVDDRIGSLQPGKDADFVVLTGEPFAVGTMVEDTFVDGARAYHRVKESEMLVVKAGRIITLEGQTIENGAVVVAGSKIHGIGKDQTIPGGARVIDLSGSVLVPGFVDAFSHAGLSGDGTGIPTGKAAHRVAKVVQHDDPVLHTLLQAGLTTVLVSGRDSALVSGRVAAIKTGAADQDSMVLKDIAGIRFVHDNITPGSVKALEGQINKAKAYIAKWKKYEKDLADWKSGKRKKPAEKKPESEKPAAENEMDLISGFWKIEAVEGMRFRIGFALELKLEEDSAITGTVQMTIQGRVMGGKSEIIDGEYDKGAFSFAFEGGMGRGAKTTFEGTVVGEELVGKVAMGGRRRMEGDFRAVRTSGEPSERAGSGSTVRRGKKTKDGSPQKPPIDDSLEPMKALLEGRVPAIINTTRAEAITEVVAWFEKNKLPFILHGARDAVDTPEILGASRPGFLFTPKILTRKGRDVKNAAAKISAKGYPVGLVSGDTEGSRYLPVHAALAVRYGMDPTEALKAISIYPARMFKLDHRIGSLKRGKDADFVVFSGNPLEMTSRVQLVVVNGKVVVDNRKQQRKNR